MICAQLSVIPLFDASLQTVTPLCQVLVLLIFLWCSWMLRKSYYPVSCPYMFLCVVDVLQYIYNVCSVHLMHQNTFKSLTFMLCKHSAYMAAIYYTWVDKGIVWAASDLATYEEIQFISAKTICCQLWHIEICFYIVFVRCMRLCLLQNRSQCFCVNFGIRKYHIVIWCTIYWILAIQQCHWNHYGQLHIVFKNLSRWCTS